MAIKDRMLLEPASAAALRGDYLRWQLSEPGTAAAIGFAALVGGLVVGVAAAPVFGVLAAIAIVVCGLAVVFFIVHRRSHRDFFATYARERGLELVEEGLPEVTPILYAGSGRRTELAIEGELAEGLTGTIAHYSYLEEVPVARSTPSATRFELTIVLIEVPEVATVFPKILCHGRIGSQQTDKLDDALSGRNRKRLRLESEAFNRRFEVFYDPDQDEVRLRRLFAPANIVWMAESMPTAFELVNGHLVCFASDHLSSAAELDLLVSGGVELARRLRAEATK